MLLRLLAKDRGSGMEKTEDTIPPEDFANVVDVFRTLRKWRDENNQSILEEESSSEISKRKEERDEEPIST